MKKHIPALLIVLAFLFMANNANCTSFYLQASGHPTLLSSWNSKPDGTGTIPTRFNSANDNWVFQVAGARSTETITVVMPMHPSGSVTIGSGFHLVQFGAGRIYAKYRISATASLTIDNSVPYPFQFLDINSTVIYGANSNSVLAAGGGSLSYGDLRISKSIALSGAACRIAGQLILDASCTLSLNSVPLIMSGQGTTMFSGAGVMYGTGSSTLQLSGGNGGNNGTLNFSAGGSTLHTLNLNLGSAADQVSLGSGLTVTGNFSHGSGGLDLNGQDLHLNSNIAFPASAGNGAIHGDDNASLHMQSGTVSGNLLLDPGANTLRALGITGGAVGIGNQVVIIDSLSVKGGGALSANGNILLNSDATRKARIAEVSGTISGNITVETFISGGNTGWMHMGVSGVDNQTIADWDTYPSSNGANGIPMTCVGCAYSPTVTSPSFHSIQGWDEPNADYDASLTASSPLTPGKGFWVYVGMGSSVTSDLMLINTGPVVSGVQAYNLTSGSSDGLNLVANIYASPISWTRVHGWTQAVHPGEVAAEIHIFSPDAGYASYVAGAPTGVNGGSDILPMGQGFYVSTGSNNAQIIFTEDAKDDGNTGDLYRTSGAKNDYAYFKLMIDGAWGRDETMFNFERLSSPYFDKDYDAHKLFRSAGYAGYGDSYSKYTTLSTKDVNGTDYAINSMPPLTSSLSVPLLARVMSSGNHTISISESENYAGCLILHDKLTGVYHDLSKTPYAFDISDTTSVPRFDLLLCRTESGPALSVDELNDKSAIVIGQNANAAFVRTHFKQPTKAVISAFNIVGQQLMNDMEIEGTDNVTELPINVSNQVVIIRVSTPTESIVKKIIAH